jgi:hypothetical protein
MHERTDHIFALDNPRVVDSLNVPAGNYLLIATISAWNSDGDPQDLGCTLNPTGRAETIRVLGDEIHYKQMTIIAPFSTAAAATVSLTCGGFQILPVRTAISALSVSSITSSSQ